MDAEHHHHHHHHQQHQQHTQTAVVVHASSQLHMHDVIFHVIFGSDLYSILEFVRASAVRLHSITECQFLVAMMNSVIAQVTHQHSTTECFQRCGPDTVKALFFLFLNVDMVLKEYICNPTDRRAFAAAMNIRYRPARLGAATGGGGGSKGNKQQQEEEQQHQALERMHAWSMIGTKPMNAAKGRRFFTVLHDKIVRMWLQDQRLHASDLVRMVKEEYLVC